MLSRNPLPNPNPNPKFPNYLRSPLKYFNPRRRIGEYQIWYLLCSCGLPVAREHRTRVERYGSSIEMWSGSITPSLSLEPLSGATPIEECKTDLCIFWWWSELFTYDWMASQVMESIIEEQEVGHLLRSVQLTALAILDTSGVVDVGRTSKSRVAAVEWIQRTSFCWSALDSALNGALVCPW